MRARLLNLLLCVGTTAFLFGAAELACRALVRPPMSTVMEHFSTSAVDTASQTLRTTRMPDQLYQYTSTGGVRLTPNATITIDHHHTSNRTVTLRTNQFGFRGSSVPHEKGTEHRILVLGDSVTLGDHVEERDTYPAQLEQSIDPAEFPGKTIRVINAGMGSADIANEWQVLQEIGLQTDPDQVLLGLYLNDGELSANVIVRPLPGPLARSYFLNFVQRRLAMAWYRWSHREALQGSDRPWIQTFTAGRTLREGDWRTNRDHLDFLIVRHVRDWGAAWDPAMWVRVAGVLDAMQTALQQRRIPLTVALFPVRYQVEAAFVDDRPQQYFQQLMAERRIFAIDLLPLLRAAWQADPTRALFYDQCHLTEAGYRLVSEALAQAIPLTQFVLN